MSAPEASGIGSCYWGLLYMVFMNPFSLWEVITEPSSLIRLATCNKIQSQTKAFTSCSPGSSTLPFMTFAPDPKYLPPLQAQNTCRW